MKEYIEHRLTVAGCRKKIFNEGAYKRIYKLSEGVPRLVNIIADKSMLKAFVDRAKLVDANHVEELEYAKSTTDIKKVSEKPEPAPVEEVVTIDEDPPAEAPSKKFNIRAVLWTVVIAIVALGLYFQPWKYFTNIVEAQEKVEVVESPVIAAAEIDTVVVEEIPEIAQEQEIVEEPEQKPVLEQEEAVVEGYSWPEPESEKFWVHVGSFQNKDNAETLAIKLTDAGFNVAVNSSELAGTVYHRVFTGPASSKDQAQDIATQVKANEDVIYTMVKYIR
jgi:cell division septation protein DedD